MTIASSFFSFRRVFPAFLLLSLALFPLRSLKAAAPSTDPGNGGVVIPPNDPYLLSPSSLTFSDIPVGQASPVQSMTFTNNSSSKLTGITVAMDAANPEFAETNTCTELAVGESCQIDVTFTPSAEGSKTTTLNLSFKHSIPTGAVMISLGGVMTTSVTEMFLVPVGGNGLSTGTPGSGLPSNGDGSGTPSTNNQESGGGGCSLMSGQSSHSLTISSLVLALLTLLMGVRGRVSLKKNK